MFAKLSCSLMVVLTILAGCVPSLNPVYTDAQLVFDPDVLGVWVQPKSQNTWEFTKLDEKSYRLVYTEQSGQQGRFVGHLANIDGTLFLDLFPEEIEMDVSGFYKFHLVPIHTIYQIRSTGPSLELVTADYDALQQHLEDHPDELAFATFNGRKLITAPTPQLQDFLVAHPELFTSSLQLHRQAGSVN